VSCPHCSPVKSEKQKQRAAARHRQVLLARQRGQKHIGDTPLNSRLKQQS
jgi:UPF0176 protein